MFRTISLLATLVSGAATCCLAQTSQSDSGSVNGSDPAKDAKLVATPPVPADEQQQFEQAIKDIHFDFDKSDIRPEDRSILAQDAEWLKAHPDVVVTLEGDADERGSVVYNLALSGERAQAAKDALVGMGVAPDRIAFATGWGKLYPVCTQTDESCWSQNRRTHFYTWPPVENATSVASRGNSPAITPE
jgi:peptidoglycan-associated lipoprotein